VKRESGGKMAIVHRNGTEIAEKCIFSFVPLWARQKLHEGLK